MENHPAWWMSDGSCPKKYLPALLKETQTVVSSGIAATLIYGGKPAHSTFKLPFNFNYSEIVFCNTPK